MVIEHCLSLAICDGELRRALYRVLAIVAGLSLVAVGDNADAQWADQRAFGPFICRANFSLARHEQLFGELAQIQAELVQRLGLPPAQERIEIYLFSNGSSYRRYLKQRLPNVPYRRAMYVKDNGPGMVLAYLSSELETDVRHESTHALLHAVLPMVPLWLDEGLAEYFEVPADQRATGNPHYKATIWQMRLGRVPRLASLEKHHKVEDMGRGEYRNSWAWAHFLLLGPPAARQELIAYFSDIRASTPPGQLSERLERHLPDVEGHLVEHFKTFGR